MTRELAIYDSTLWNWTKHARIDRGEREGLTSDERAESRFFLPLAGEVAEARNEPRSMGSLSFP